MPPEAEWFANIENPNTRRAYQNDLKSFMRFVGIEKASEFRTVSSRVFPLRSGWGARPNLTGRSVSSLAQVLTRFD